MSTTSREAGARPEEERFDRRAFIARGALVAGAAALAGCGGARKPPTLSVGAQAPPNLPRRHRRPNILVIVVDQRRVPRWFPNHRVLERQLPNISALARESVFFASHFTASNDCTPARAALLTGLHTHQTGCLITGRSTLSPGFPTWGSMLREHGYHTAWYGKWHLTNGDNLWLNPTDAGALEPYGFSGGTLPSPDGGPGQGHRVDPYIAHQFEEWFRHNGADGPWCTTVSFVNPHDIAWWYRYTDFVPAESTAPALIDRLPGNFETPEQLIARRKPRLQRSLQDTAAASFGSVDFTGPQARQQWLDFMNLYLRLQSYVDAQIGRVLYTLASRPRVAENTIVVFTSDHGEYAASHGLRGKGAAVYDEAIHVPLLIKDPRRLLAPDPGSVRHGLTSSVDVAPLLLTIAAGGDQWRRDARYEHLSGRADLAAMLANPRAPGRRFVLHATDEIVTEFASQPYAADAPLHVIAVRTANAKYATYSNWQPETIAIQNTDQDTELYDYRSAAGRSELHNAIGQSRLEEPMRALLDHATAAELRRPLPAHLRQAQAHGFVDYFKVANETRLTALRARLQTDRLQSRPAELGLRGQGHPLGGGLQVPRSTAPRLPGLKGPAKPNIKPPGGGAVQPPGLTPAPPGQPSGALTAGRRRALRRRRASTRR